jgi:hypothetical protein
VLTLAVSLLHQMWYVWFFSIYNESYVIRDEDEYQWNFLDVGASGLYLVARCPSQDEANELCDELQELDQFVHSDDENFYIVTEEPMAVFRLPYDDDQCWVIGRAAAGQPDWEVDEFHMTAAARDFFAILEELSEDEAAGRRAFFKRVIPIYEMYMDKPL